MSTQKLKYWILSFIVFAIILLIYERHVILDYALKDTSVSESQLIKFSKTFLKEYISLVERTVDQPHHMYFQFYSEKPYETRIIKSNSKGAALIFIPSNTSEYSYQTTNLEIEAAIFPSKELSENEQSVKILETVFKCTPNHPCFVVKARNSTFESLEFVTIGKEWIEVIGEGTVTTRNIVANKVFYPNLIKMKASTLRKSWSGNEAKREAEELFEWEFWPAFGALEDFREYLAYPELEEIAIHIEENRRENRNYTMFDFKKDFERLYLTATSKYNVRSDFAEKIYGYVTGRHTLKKKLLGIEYTNNWSYTAYSVIIILLICSFIILLNFLFKLSHGTKFYPLLKELKKLKKIIGPADAISPLFVCWYLDRQRPINIIPMQRLIPWIIALVCAGFIYYIERKLHSSSETQ